MVGEVNDVTGSGLMPLCSGKNKAISTGTVSPRQGFWLRRGDCREYSVGMSQTLPHATLKARVFRLVLFTLSPDRMPRGRTQGPTLRTDAASDIFLFPCVYFEPRALSSFPALSNSSSFGVSSRPRLVASCCDLTDPRLVLHCYICFLCA